MHNEIIQENLEVILESIGIIESRFVEIKNPDDFLLTPYGVTIFDSIAIRLQYIGELLKQIEKLEQNYLLSYPDVEWSKIIRLRDLISHHYDYINPTIVFSICEKDIPVLKLTIDLMLKEFNQ